MLQPWVRGMKVKGASSHVGWMKFIPSQWPRLEDLNDCNLLNCINQNLPWTKQIYLMPKTNIPEPKSLGDFFLVSLLSKNLIAP